MSADYMLIHYVLCLCNIFISGKFTKIPHPRINVSKMTGKPGGGGIWPGDRYTDRYAGISYISRYDMVMVLCIY